jgi:hypothetical protein
MRKFPLPLTLAFEPAPAGGRPEEDRTPCEHCLCAACEKLCMKCSISCSPMHSRYIPLIGCPDFVDMRLLKPLRYTYRGGADIEYRLHLKTQSR